MLCVDSEILFLKLEVIDDGFELAEISHRIEDLKRLDLDIKSTTISKYHLEIRKVGMGLPVVLIEDLLGLLLVAHHSGR